MSRSASAGDLERMARTATAASVCAWREKRGETEGEFGGHYQFRGKGVKSSQTSGSKSYSPKIPRKKFKWRDPISGHALTAGGILFYDDQGVWVIGERDKNGIVYTDIGGRYAYEDGNIWAAIARELREETYGTCELFARDIINLSRLHSPVYVNGHDNRPVYVCLVVPLNSRILAEQPYFALDPANFSTCRQRTLMENPDVPEDYYCPCVLTKLSYEELKTPEVRLSYRLKRVLKFSTDLWKKVAEGTGLQSRTTSLKDSASDETKSPFGSEQSSPYDTDEEVTDE